MVFEDLSQDQKTQFEAHLRACYREKHAVHFERLRCLLVLRRTDPSLLSQFLVKKRVARGIHWLVRHAPHPGWWRNCLDFRYGSRIRTAYSEENVVARAFEYESHFADEFGYVQDWKVLKHFFGPFWSLASRRLGFSSGFLNAAAPYPNRHPNVAITDELLDREWAAFVEDPPDQWLINYRHETPLNAPWLFRTERRRTFLEWLSGMWPRRAAAI